MRIFYEIELFKIIGRNWIKSTDLWHICCLFTRLKKLCNFLFRGGAVDFFLIEIVYFFFSIKLCRCLRKNQLHVVRTRSLIVLLASSDNDNHESLGADLEETL
jgi:hypothetical protein